MFKYIFGPVNSRRLKRSLGVDPIGDKICSFNCVYCEIQKTKSLTIQRKPYVNPILIFDELKRFFKHNSISSIDCITIAGKGEPTLHSHLKYIIKTIKKTYPDIPLVVLTNASLLHDENVRSDLLDADIIIPSLDAVSYNVYKKINLPFKSITPDLLVEGIFELRKQFYKNLTLEILFVKNLNDSKEEINMLKNATRYIKPNAVQINTIYRPPAFSKYLPIDDNMVLILQQEFDDIIKSIKQQSIPLNSNAYKHLPKSNILDNHNMENIRTDLFALLRTRPSTKDDIYAIFDKRFSKNSLDSIIQSAVNDNLLVSSSFNNKTFYRLK